MNPDQQKVEAIFHAAKELDDADERESYLLEVCQGDVELKAKAEALLKSAVKAEAVFGGDTDPDSRQERTLVNHQATEGPGTVISRYKLLQRIGEGGFGVVYMAEQQEPVARRVALKIVKPGMDTRQVIARFEAERQALALMDHPHVARVLDAGATESGRPFFVMELVKGIPITEFCDQRRLNTRDRVELFIKVCQAVQHAHQKGIIHRDLKPSNVMITLIDGEPVPKIIDFGVAKAIGQRLTQHTLFTRYDQLIGTPAYMSPEQAELSGVDVDTRSDIYSLGVLLYQLLTGSSPIDEKTLKEAGVDEIRRLVRETVPPKPSTRLQSMGKQLTTVAEQRQVDPSTICRSMVGELDWIVMKCLEKDRARRYETANGLAMDLQRHLNNEPVVARPPSRLYEFQKTVRRHWVGFAFTAVVIFVLATGVVVSSWLAVRARRAEREQTRLRADAEAALKVSGRNAAETLYRLGDPPAALVVLERAVQQWPKQPHLWYAKGLVSEQNGRIEEAVQDFTQAIGLFAGQPDTTETDMNEALLARFRVLKSLGRFPEATIDFCRANGIPLRDASAPPTLIDLSLFYRAPLTKSLHSVFNEDLENNLAEVPRGLQEFAGVQFDVRGVVSLNGDELRRVKPRVEFPQAVTNVPIGLKFARLQCFMGTGWSEKDGVQIGTFILRYSNGRSEELPIRYGIHVRDVLAQPTLPDDDNPLEHGAVVWRGMNDFAQRKHGHLRLYLATWDNPHPGEEVISMDFTSTMTPCAPFLIAMTVE